MGHPRLLSAPHRLLESAMSGKYLHDGFTLPCPPGLNIPEEDGYTITPNTLKVQTGRGVLGYCPRWETQGNLGVMDWADLGPQSPD